MLDFILKARAGPSFNREARLRLSPPDPVYFMGICGTAMASLAIYLRQKGFQVSGSDQNVYPPMSSALEREGIPVFPYSAGNIKKSFKLIIVGNVISQKHPEILKAQELGRAFLSFPEFLEQAFLRRTKNIVIAGTHGKSSCAALMAHIAKTAGQAPGFFIGAKANDFPLSFHFEGSNYFVIEGDEYDSAFFAKKPKFFYYKPFASLLTGLEFDHGDIYKSLDEIESAFRAFAQKIPGEGCLAVPAQDRRLRKLAELCAADTVFYGLSEGDWTLKGREIKGNRQVFEICHKGEIYPCSISLLGEHSALNALGVFALSRKLGWPAEKILKALESFKGLKRRLEKKGQIQGMKIYEDFAHHPTAVWAGLRALKERYAGQRLTALFEPRSFTSRLSYFQKDYVKAFRPADAVFIAPPYDSSKIPQEKRFSAKRLAQDLKREGKPAFAFDSFEALDQAFWKQAKKGGVAVFMTSGAFGGLLRKIEKAIAS